VETGSDFPPDVSAGCHQTFNREVRFLIITLDVDKNAGRAGIVSQGHAADIGQADARIAQLAFKDGVDLFTQGFCQAAPVVTLCAPLHYFTS
jgi:hypothetical protein